MLYAHFEGFSKFCWDTVLDHVQSEKLQADALSDNFMLLALEPSFRAHRGQLSADAIWNYFKGDLPSALKNVAVFEGEARLTTESNLWPNVFERESQRIGILCEELQSHRVRIKALVARRNEIAHGKSMVIETVAEYHEYENAAFCVMHDLAIKSMQIIESKVYRR